MIFSAKSTLAMSIKSLRRHPHDIAQPPQVKFFWHGGTVYVLWAHSYRPLVSTNAVFKSLTRAHDYRWSTDPLVNLNLCLEAQLPVHQNIHYNTSITADTAPTAPIYLSFSHYIIWAQDPEIIAFRCLRQQLSSNPKGAIHCFPAENEPQT